MPRERATPDADQQLTDDEVKSRLLEDPEVRSRVEEGLRRVRRGDRTGPGIDAEGLRDLLRDGTDELDA
jgi:hypothetical protein